LDKEKIEQYYHGVFSEQDESYVNDVFRDDKSEKELNKLLKRQFSELPANEEDDRNLDHILHKIHFDINTRLSSRKKPVSDIFTKWALGTAVAILLPLVVFLGIKIFRDDSMRKETWVEIKAPAWTRAQFSLPDGSTGWLNSNSSIKYCGDFLYNRQVSLKGEAYFDVFKDPKRPFSVNTAEVNVKVLGTRFNIASYDNEKTVEVLLEEGKLLFNDNAGSNPCMMKPNDLVVYNKTSKNFSTEVVQPQKYIAWTDGKLVFRNDPPDVIARRLERWYNIDVELKSVTPIDLRWRATFVDDNLEEVLKMLKRSLHLDYKIENQDINPDETISKKKVTLSYRTK
jgi:transmembrane sensor